MADEWTVYTHVTIAELQEVVATVLTVYPTQQSIETAAEIAHYTQHVQALIQIGVDDPGDFAEPDTTQAQANEAAMWAIVGSLYA